MQRLSILSSVASGTLPIPLAARSILPLLLSITLSWWDPPGAAFAQEDSVAANSAALGGDFLNNNLGVDASITDSLRLREFEMEIQQLRLQVTETNFLHRVLPQIHVSASFEMNNIVFIDPINVGPYILPKDAYRLSMSLSISDLFDGAKHSMAELELERLQTQYQRIKHRQATLITALHRKRSELDQLSGMLNEELAMKEAIVRFNSMRFEHGKIEYDALIRSKLDVIALKKNIHRLNHAIEENEFKISTGN